MKNYYAILEVPVGCGVAEINRAYQRLTLENRDNGPAFADLKEAYEVLTSPARRADYDQTTWGETFSAAAPAAPSVPTEATWLPRAASGSPLPGARCPMGIEAQCPVLLMQVGQGETYCPECGYLLAALGAGNSFEAVSTDTVKPEICLVELGGRSHTLRPGMNLVGRESGDVLLPDKTVSRQHARVEVGEDGTITVEDLGSTNGTQAGGEVLVPHVLRAVQSGDRVRFGSVVLELRVSSLEAPSGASAAADAVPSPSAAPPPFSEDQAGTPLPRAADPAAGKTLAARAQMVETREEAGRTYPLVPGVTTFGRRADNSVVLPGDPYVSGSHAQIIADGAVFRLTDVGSTNGTLLNGQRLAINEPAALSPGDVVLIGGTAMRFELLETPEEPDAPAEPRERTAPEYDVPDESSTGESSTDDDSTDSGVAEAAPVEKAPTQAER